MTFSMPEMPDRRRSEFTVDGPNLGLYLGRSPREVPDRGMSDCLNVRIRNRKITNENVGYERLFNQLLGNQVLLIDAFELSSGSSITIFGTKTDLFQYDTPTNAPLYITPRYATGTVDVTNGSPTVTQNTGTTAWLTNLKAGDFITIGSATEDDPAATWYEIQSVDSDTQLTLTTNYGEATDTNVAYTARKVFTADDTDVWVTDVFPDAPLGTTSALAQGDHWFATNGSELVVWDGSASTVVVISTSSTGLGFSCKTLAYYKNMMLYGNLVESGTAKPGSFKNTAIGDPENVTTLEANEFFIAESVDFLDALVPLGDFVVGYCEDSINIVQFIAAPFYFAIRTVAPDIGIYGPKCVANFGDFHEFLGLDQIYRFDGTRLIPYGNHVFEEVLRTVDRARSRKAVAQISEEEHEVYWVVPLTSDSGTEDDRGASVAFVEHYSEIVGNFPTPFTKRSLPATAMGFFVSSPLGRWDDYPSTDFDEVTFRFNDRFFSSEFPVILFGDDTGMIYKLNTVTRLDTDGLILTFVRSPERELGRSGRRGQIRRAEPYLEKIASSSFLTINAFTRERPNGDEASESGIVSIMHDGTRFAPFRLSGRYGSVQFGTLATDNIFVLDGYRVVSEETSER